jgi:segregation and condensation protein B
MPANEAGVRPGEGAEQRHKPDEPQMSESGQSDDQRPSGGPGWPAEKLMSILESLLFAAGEPVSLAQLANALEEVSRERILKTLNDMAGAYASGERGLVLEQIAGGYQLRTRSEHAIYVRRLLSAKPPRLSRAVLEALAIIAYRQPITRPEIEQLRGVDSGGVLDTLMDRNLIKIAGRKDAPGRPIEYATTPDFLELFGLRDLDSLPDLEEFRELEGLSERATPPPQAASSGIATEGSLPQPSGTAESAESTSVAKPSSDSLVREAQEIVSDRSVATTTHIDARGFSTGEEQTSQSEKSGNSQEQR